MLPRLTAAAQLLVRAISRGLATPGGHPSAPREPPGEYGWFPVPPNSRLCDLEKPLFPGCRAWPLSCPACRWSGLASGAALTCSQLGHRAGLRSTSGRRFESKEQPKGRGEVMGNAPAASVPVPALWVPPPTLTASSRALHPWAPWGSASHFAASCCNGACLCMHILPSAGWGEHAGCGRWVSAAAGAASRPSELQERNGVGEGAGTGTSSLPTPRVSRPALRAVLGSAPFLCHSKARVQGPALSPQE